MGESVSEGTILDWLVKVGDEVEKDQGLVEVSTDKVDAELPSPVAGTVTEILAAPDDVVATGTVVARIAVGERKSGGAEERGSAEAAAASSEVGQEPAPASAGNGAENATPVAARMAAANGVDINSLQGHRPARARDEGRRGERARGERRVGPVPLLRSSARPLLRKRAPSRSAAPRPPSPAS